MAKLSDVLTLIEYKYPYSNNPEVLDSEIAAEGIDWANECYIQALDPNSLVSKPAKDRQAERLAKVEPSKVSPVTAIKSDTGLELIDGANRVEAFKITGYQIPVIVITETLYQNLKSKGVNPQYYAYNKLKSTELPVLERVN